MFKHSEPDESINDSFIGCSVQFILNCTTLAGTMWYRRTISSEGATGQRLEETKKINQSLSALGTLDVGDR
jgi:hypothetical protein